MYPTKTKDATHSYGPPANWDEKTMGKCGYLSVRVQEGAGGIMESVSSWKPTLEEINLLLDGGVVVLTICAKQPACSLHVEFSREDTAQVALDEYTPPRAG